jgi:trigger factor
VSENQPAELNEEFFKKFNAEDLESLKAEVKTNMLKDVDTTLKQQRKDGSLDGMLSLHDSVQIPAALVSQEIDAMRNQQMQQFGEMAAQLDLKSIFPDEMFKEQAERRVKLGLILNEVVSKHEVKADADAVRAAVERLADGYEDKEGFINWCYSNQDQLQQVQSMVIEEQVVDTLLKSATVKEEKMSYDELKEPKESVEA